MAMKKSLKRLAQWATAGATLVLAIFIYKDYSELDKINRYNEAVAEQNYEMAADIDSDYGAFAKAYQFHQLKDYQQARVIYAELVKTSDNALAESAQYNLANTYMQQALAVDINAEADVAFPLLELAKVTYRELLASNDQHWGAKFNLERALEISPDSRTLPNVEIPGRRNPNRTVISIDPEDSLP